MLAGLYFKKLCLFPLQFIKAVCYIFFQPTQDGDYYYHFNHHFIQVKLKKEEPQQVKIQKVKKSCWNISLQSCRVNYYCKFFSNFFSAKSIWICVWNRKFGCFDFCPHFWGIWDPNWPKMALQSWSLYPRHVWNLFWVFGVCTRSGSVFRSLIFTQVRYFLFWITQPTNQVLGYMIQTRLN